MPSPARAARSGSWPTGSAPAAAGRAGARTILVDDGALAGGHLVGDGGDRGGFVDTAIADAKFSTLVSALKAAALVETLKGPGPYTVFAPTDEAFAKLPKGTAMGVAFSGMGA